MDETQRLQAELDLAERVLRSEMSHLQELEEKRRLIADGIAEISAPSELWERYLEEIDTAARMARTRIDELAELRDTAQARLQGIQ